VNLIASFGSLISYRLHSHIIACSLDIPTVAIQWDRKVPFFFEKIGCPRRCLTAFASPRKVLARLEQARTEGYDRAAIQRQQADACGKLFETMNAYLTD
jgi:polysaccharide pyruvyl transferase WcaK-like protein